MNLIGQTIDRYHIIEEIGMGGMAIVYRAYDTRLGTDIALKLLRKEAFTSTNLQKILQRFDLEAKSLARLNHTNIVSIIDYGSYDDTPYLVMKYMQGGTLKKFTGTAMAPHRAAQLLIPVADALAYAHSCEIIHRDIKPSNILITEYGAPMLSDFGIAKTLEKSDTSLTADGVGIGTPDYMAPEQWQGEVCKACDQYSMGVIFYELVTGIKPFTADTPAAIGIKQATEPLIRPSALAKDISDFTEKVIFRALAKDPVNRFTDMNEFKLALEKVAAKNSIIDIPEYIPEPTPPRASKVKRSKDGMPMIIIPSGKFFMGDDLGNKDERPMHELELGEYWIDRFLVTNRCFRHFLSESGNESDTGLVWYDADNADAKLVRVNNDWHIRKGFEDHPVTDVNWFGAVAYCSWIGGRLPTEAEWEKANRGTDQRMYPWGNEVPNSQRANFQDCLKSTNQVDAYPSGASYYGLLDMAGNVWEWIADWYDDIYYMNSVRINPKGPDTGTARVIRGGSWANSKKYLKSTYRSRSDPKVSSSNLGFRCVMDKPG